MDMFLKRKRHDEHSNSPAAKSSAAKHLKNSWPSKTYKYEAEYIKNVFTRIRVFLTFAVALIKFIYRGQNH